MGAPEKNTRLALFLGTLGDVVGLFINPERFSENANDFARADDPAAKKLVKLGNRSKPDFCDGRYLSSPELL